MLIYEKFGYNKVISRYIHEIIMNENINYKNNYFDVEHNGYLLKDDSLDMQGGGKNEQKILENSGKDAVDVKFVYQGHKITFQKIDYGDQIHFTLNTLDDKNECLVIILSNNENKIMCADIHQISMHKNCPFVGKMYSGGGSLLLKISIEFIKSIQKEYKISQIQIKDNSEKMCVSKKVKLWLLNTLKDGLPWHIKYGFEPYDSEKMCLNEANKIKIKANVRILKRTKTSVIEEEKIFDISDPKINPLYLKYKNHSILDFFKELLSKSKENCIWIENIQDKLIDKLLLFDISGISYYMVLDKNSQYK